MLAAALFELVESPTAYLSTAFTRKDSVVRFDSLAKSTRQVECNSGHGWKCDGVVMRSERRDEVCVVKEGRLSARAERTWRTWPCGRDQGPCDDNNQKPIDAESVAMGGGRGKRGGSKLVASGTRKAASTGLQG